MKISSSINKIEQKIWDFIEKHKFIIFFIIITILSLAARYTLLNFKSGDYKSFLSLWFNTFKDNGGLKALKMEIGNYNAPYMTIMAMLTYLPIKSLYSIKAVSIFFDYVCAISGMYITFILLKDNKNRDFYGLLVYGIILFLPTVLLNSACWGQADSIYTAFILLSIIYLLKERYIISFILLGISFAFKLQFMFILPLYILIYISKRKFPIYYFLIIPIVNAILCLPAILFGKSIMSCIKVYFNQMNNYGDYLSMGFPNMYTLLFNTQNNGAMSPSPSFSKFGIIITISIFVLIAFMVLYKKIKFNKQQIIEFGLWSVLIATFFLPHMHDRYLFVGDILSVLYVIFNRDKVYVPIGISLVSAYTYGGNMFGQKTILIQYVSLLNLIILILVTKDIYKKYFAVRTKEIEAIQKD